jgi:hypothetical protein
MGCDVTPAARQLGMSPVEYTDMAGETAEAGKAATEYHVGEVLLSGVERAIPAGPQQRASATPSPLVADTRHQGVH